MSSGSAILSAQPGECPKLPVRSLRSFPRMSSKSTDPLLPRIAAGDGAAVHECLERYSPLVWSVARKFWSDLATLEDLVQEIFIDVWKSAGRYDSNKASESTFITTIARRRMIDRRRRAGSAPRTEPVEEVPLEVHDEGLASVDTKDEAGLVRRALETLKPDQRRVILMSVVDGLTHPEIAKATGIPLGTVKSHIRRGLSQTAQTLREQRVASNQEGAADES